MLRRTVAALAALALLSSLLTACHTSREWLLGDLPTTQPTSGEAWEFLLDQANEPLTPDLSNQDDMDAAHAYAAGLVYARTGNTAYRDKVHAALDDLPGTEIGGRTLSLGRQLAGWVLAADLTDYTDAGFMAWLDEVRTANIGGHGRWYSLKQTMEDTASNWGAFATSSYLAASLYLDDTAAVDHVADIFRGFLGQPDSYDGWRVTASFDESWACGFPDWDPVNPGRPATVDPRLADAVDIDLRDCGDRQGALVEDISRGESYPNATKTGLSYSWETLQGATLTALLLEHTEEHSDVWVWAQGAMLRTLEFLDRWGGFDGDNFNRVNHWVPVAIDAAYGNQLSDFGTEPAGHGRHFGFTDWYAP